MRCLSHSHQDNIIYARDNIAKDEKDEIVKRIGEIADGVFQFSDIHEHGGEVVFSYIVLTLILKSSFTGFLHRTEDLKCSALELRRSQSTGCLDDKSDHEAEFPYIDSGKRSPPLPHSLTSAPADHHVDYGESEAAGMESKERSRDNKAWNDQLSYPQSSLKTSK